MYCKNCGKEISEGAAFCGECGAKTDGTTPAQNDKYFHLTRIFSLLISPIMYLLRKCFFEEVEVNKYYPNAWANQYRDVALVPDNMKPAMFVILFLLVGFAISFKARSQKRDYLPIVLILIADVLVGIACIFVEVDV